MIFNGCTDHKIVCTHLQFTKQGKCKDFDHFPCFVKFCMEDIDANVEGFQNYGLYPSYLPALESEVFKEGDDYFGGQQIFDVFTEIGKTVPGVNYTENFAEAIEMSKNSVAKIILDNENVEKVLNDEQKEMEAKFVK